jgi:hypothetical protein
MINIDYESEVMKEGIQEKAGINANHIKPFMRGALMPKLRIFNQADDSVLFALKPGNKGGVVLCVVDIDGETISRVLCIKVSGVVTRYTGVNEHLGLALKPDGRIRFVKSHPTEED